MTPTLHRDESRSSRSSFVDGAQLVLGRPSDIYMFTAKMVLVQKKQRPLLDGEMFCQA